MSNPVTCEIKGLEELQVKLEAMSEKMSKKGLREALKEGGAIIKEQIENRSPDRTGFLREHFNMKLSLRGKGDIAGSVFVGPDNAVYPKHVGVEALTILMGVTKKEQIKALENAKGRISVVSVCRFLEFGTSKMGKKPFITAAFKSVGSKALDAVIKVLKNIVEGGE